MKYLKQLGLVLTVIVIGTIIDYIVHSASESFYVPFEYYRNKVIFGVFYAFIFLHVWRWLGVKRAEWLALTAFGTVAVLLQVKYFLQGYDLFFVILFLFLHFLMFFIPGVFMFRRFKFLFE